MRTRSRRRAHVQRAARGPVRGGRDVVRAGSLGRLVARGDGRSKRNRTPYKT